MGSMRKWKSLSAWGRWLGFVPLAWRDLVYSEFFFDALRNIGLILIPGTLLYVAGYPVFAIYFSLGVLMGALTDSSGNTQDKWGSLFWGVPCLFVATCGTGLLLGYPVALVFWLGVLAFFSSMLSVFGARVAAVSLVALVSSTFTIGLWPEDAIIFSSALALGALFFYLFSLLQSYLFPFYALRFAIAGSFRLMSRLIHAKGDCYDEHIVIEKVYQQLGLLHIRVSDQQELTRSLLLRDYPKLAKRYSKSEFWLAYILALIDLYELLTALDYDYEEIRTRLSPTAALPEVRQLIGRLGDQVYLLSHIPLSKRQRVEFSQRSANLLQEVHRLESSVVWYKDLEASNMLLSTCRNISQIVDHIARISRLSTESTFYLKDKTRHQLNDFVSYPSRGIRAMLSSLHFRGPLFPFALRMALLFGIGGCLGLVLPDYRYVYWVLLTLTLVARPSFSHTIVRNRDRIVGTLLGVTIGFLAVSLINQPFWLFLVATAGFFGFFLFNKVNYMYSILCLTPAVLVGLDVYEGGLETILGSRVAFTLLGGVLALMGWYIVPFRQSRSLSGLAEAVLQTNHEFLDTIYQALDSRDAYDPSVRLARKAAHAAMASFSDAVLQLQHEPGRRALNLDKVHEFHSWVYRQNSLIIGFSVSAVKKVVNMEDDVALASRYRMISENLNAAKNRIVDFKKDER